MMKMYPGMFICHQCGVVYGKALFGANESDGRSICSKCLNARVRRPQNLIDRMEHNRNYRQLQQVGR